MKQTIKIKTCNDLERGDVWLGMVCKGVYTRDVCPSICFENGIQDWRPDAVDALIAAGNNTVLRETKAVEFELSVLHQGELTQIGIGEFSRLPTGRWKIKATPIGDE
jgi:hypothetical protein